MNLAQFGQDAKSVLAAVAPLLGTAIGGPFGGLAGTFLAKALGTSDPKAMEAAITSGDPDILLKMKQADNDFKAHIADLGVQEDALIYADKASARQREEVVKDNVPMILAYGVTLGFFVVMGRLIAYGKPVEGGDVLMVLMGSLGTAWTGIIAYYFGSSSSSAKKTDAMAAAIKNGS